MFIKNLRCKFISFSMFLHAYIREIWTPQQTNKLEENMCSMCPYTRFELNPLKRLAYMLNASSKVTKTVTQPKSSAEALPMKNINS